MITHLFLCAALQFPGGDEGSTMVTIECKDLALIRGTEVLLRDVARIDTKIPELTLRIAEIKLTNRPAYGINRILGRHDLLMQLVKTGLSVDQIRFTGASEIVVQPQTTLLKPADLREAADPILQAALDSEPDADIEHELSSLLRSIKVPPGRVSLNLRARLKGIQPSGATVEVTVEVDGESYKTIDLQYRLRRYSQMLVAGRAIKAGEQLSIDNLVQRRLLLAPESSFNVANFKQVIDKVAARNIRVNQPLHLGHLADPTIIFAKQMVSLVLRSPRIKIESRGQALRDGSIGQRIPVLNLSTRKQTWGHITAPGVVTMRVR